MAKHSVVMVQEESTRVDIERVRDLACRSSLHSTRTDTDVRVRWAWACMCVACNSDELLLWDINDKKKPSSKRLTGAGHNRAIFGITFLPDDPRHFVTHSMDRQVCSTSTQTGVELMDYHHADYLVELRQA